MWEESQFPITMCLLKVCGKEVSSLLQCGYLICVGRKSVPYYNVFIESVWEESQFPITMCLFNLCGKEVSSLLQCVYLICVGRKSVPYYNVFI